LLRKREGELFEESFIAEEALSAFDIGGEAAAGQDLDVFCGLPDETPLLCRIKYGVGKGVVGSFFGSGGETQEVVLR
jgi:hypothetical protein